MDTPTWTPLKTNKEKGNKAAGRDQGRNTQAGSNEKANVLAFNNATRPDRTRPACLVPFEMVTKRSLREQPEQASLSLQPAVGEGEGAFRPHKGFQTREDKKTYGGGPRWSPHGGLRDDLFHNKYSQACVTEGADGYLRSVLASLQGFGAVKFNPGAATRQSDRQNRLRLEPWKLPWTRTGLPT